MRKYSGTHECLVKAVASIILVNLGSSMGQFWGSIIWTDILSPIQTFLKLQVWLNTAQYFIRLNVVISLVCETVSCVM